MLFVEWTDPPLELIEDERFDIVLETMRATITIIETDKSADIFFLNYKGSIRHYTIIYKLN